MPLEEVSRVKQLLTAFAEAAGADEAVVPDPTLFDLAAEHDERDHRVLATLIADALSDQR